MKTKHFLVALIFLMGISVSQLESAQMESLACEALIMSFGSVTWEGDTGTCTLIIPSSHPKPVGAIMYDTGMSCYTNGQTITFRITREAFELFGSPLQTYITFEGGGPNHPFAIYDQDFAIILD